MNLIPSSLIASKWHKAASRLEAGTLHFTAPNGEVTLYRGRQAGPVADFKIHDWDVFRLCMSRGDIGLGEAYIDGMWDSTNIETLVSLFLLNMDSLDGFTDGNLLQRIGFVLHDTLMRRNSVKGSSRNIKDHYDVGNDFYSLWLDPSMTYSSALYAGADKALQTAQRDKYERIVSKLNGEKSSVLEIGCGWGGFAECAAANSHHVTGLTISPSQQRYAVERLKNADVEIRLEDYRKTTGTFDNIVSIEMFEAVGEHYWPAYFQTVSERLKRGGRAVVQTITIRDELFAGYRTRSDFIRHYVFPGGMLPSLARFREEADRAGLKTVSAYAFGQDYARTLREWSVRMMAAKDAILALGHDDKFMRNWEFYLAICASSFAVDRSNVVQVELAHA
jgi:cyclopropane-fatty-acyl-phospholipid synthase